jgi:hypothetical protein
MYNKKMTKSIFTTYFKRAQKHVETAIHAITDHKTDATLV